MTSRVENLSSRFVVALAQMVCVPDRQRNVAMAVQFIERAAKQGANVICLPELFAGLYPCQKEDHSKFAEAEPIPGPTSETIAQAAKRAGIVVIASLFEKRAPGIYHNTVVVYDRDGQTAGLYRKMHIPDDPLYYEKFYFTPGDLGFRAFDTAAGRIGTCVCWDQWFPEAARLTALSGAEIIFYPTAIGWLPDEKATYGKSQHLAWETMMRSHAIANGLFVAAVNRSGKEGEVEFWGASFLSDPYGNILAKSAHEGEDLLIVNVDRSLIETARTHWPFLRDRRTDAYSGLSQRWNND